MSDAAIGAPGRSIRDATANDAASIADLHALSWRDAYRAILPAEYLAGPIVDERRAYWRRAMAAPAAGAIVLTAHDADALAGFIAIWPDPEARFDAYLDNLHVRPDWKGRGIGRRLLGAAATRLADTGRASLYLWLFDGNAAGLGFYLKLGATIGDRGSDTIGGREIAITRLFWRDCRALAAACRAGL